MRNQLVEPVYAKPRSYSLLMKPRVAPLMGPIHMAFAPSTKGSCCMRHRCIGGAHLGWCGVTMTLKEPVPIEPVLEFQQ